MNIDYPRPEQTAGLRSLWKAAFGDEDEFLDPYFEIAYDPKRCRCITIDDAIAAALYWFDTFCGDQRYAYVYGVATDPEFRGQGLCTRLMEDTARLLGGQGYDGILLYPASEALSRMYGKMGYTRCTTVSEFRCEAGPVPAVLRRIEQEEYARLRREYLPVDGVIQEGPMLAFLATQAEFYAGKDFVAAVSTGEEKIHCHELLGNLSDAPGIVRALGEKSGFFRTFGNEKSFVMGYPLSENYKKPVYFGLPLD